MRKMMLAALAALAVPAAAVAQSAEAPAPVCATGEVTRIRMSKLKPGATMAQFEEAVAAHVAWYKTHGFAIDQRIAPVMRWKDGKPMISADEVMTFASGDNVPREKRDKGWTDFVAKYRAVSDVAFEQVVCMPAHH
ncbi:MAG: hypothetical protein GC147_11395 [Porphyrobacter sp.]|nr:hypothetical protein [Porphyrobacter sp.]